MLPLSALDRAFRRTGSFALILLNYLWSLFARKEGSEEFETCPTATSQPNNNIKEPLSGSYMGVKLSNIVNLYNTQRKPRKLEK